jgi:hypothetical protein
MTPAKQIALGQSEAKLKPEYRLDLAGKLTVLGRYPDIALLESRG